VYRGQHVPSERRRDQLPAVTGDAECRAQERLGGSGAEAYHHTRFHQCHLAIEPWPAGGDLAPIRLLLDAPLAARLPAEVLRHVRDVRLRAVDSGLGERPLQELSRRADERPTGEILVVARLLADEHQGRVRLAVPADRLGGPLPEVTRPALLRRPAQRRQGGGRAWRRRHA
jgi:hypothetical protein